MMMFDERSLEAVVFLANAILFILAFLAAIAVVFYLLDRLQSKNAIRRNFPLIGRFRSAFEYLGEFFRQYFFAMDREELPFNRAQRNWVYNASQNLDNTVPFGSTRDIRAPGTTIFVNCPYPTLEEHASQSKPLTIGPNTENPYQAPSFFNISGMSYGALSKPAVRALSRGARAAGCWINTGEGGLSEWHLEGKPDIVFQIGTAKYGVRGKDGLLDDRKLKQLAQRSEVKMFEIKLSQGAKPGKGGILPGTKVTPEIAKIRGIPKGQDSISPNRHPEINDTQELLQFIARVKRITKKPVGIKAVIGATGWLEDLASGIKQSDAMSCPDFITVDSADGGTGAAPLSLIDNVGLHIHESLPLVVDMLTDLGLRDRIRVIASGKLTTPADVAWAFCVGADFVVSARGFMFALGCIQALKCNKDTCPTGITTHRKSLQKGLNPKDKSVRVAHYVQRMRDEVGTISHSCGVNEPRQLKRKHARMVMPDGSSKPLEELYA